MDTRKRIISLIENIYPSDAAFERELNLPEKKVYDWRGGRSKSYAQIIPEIAKALNTTSAYLLCETDDPTPPGQNKKTVPEDELTDEFKAILKDLRVLPEDKRDLFRRAIALEASLKIEKQRQQGHNPEQP